MTEILAGNDLVGGLWNQYVGIVEEINAYNAQYNVTVEADAYTPTKALTEARALDDSGEGDAELLKLLSAHKTLTEKIKTAKLAVADKMSALTGKSLAADKPSASDEEKSAIREKRTRASNIVKSINQMATLYKPVQPEAAAAIEKALEENPLPYVGSGEASWSPTQPTTPKYRVDVTARVNGEVVLADAPGFAKAALANGKLHSDKKFMPDANDFRKAWEEAGNSVGNTVAPTVQFTTEDNVEYTLVARPKKA